MKIKLPTIVETLVEASNEKNLDKYLSCFLDNATVADIGENDMSVGKEDIGKSFKARKYTTQSEPLDIHESAENIKLKLKVSGDFKGSPLNFLYNIELKFGLIQKLKIELA